MIFAVRVYGAIDRWVLKTFDSVVAVSEEVRGRLLKARVSPERIHCIRNGVNLSPFANVAQIRRARQQSGAKFHIGLVGRLAPEKGVDIFLHAAAEIRKKHPDVGFLIAGDGPDRELLDSLKDNLALGDSVTFCGLSDDMPAFYASIDLLVSASRREGMPIALLEAIAAGLPVVATSVGAVPEVIRNGHNGLLVPPCSVSDLTNAVSQLLEDVNLRKALAESAQRSASEEFSAERMSADHCDLYRRVINSVMRSKQVHMVEPRAQSNRSSTRRSRPSSNFRNHPSIKRSSKHFAVLARVGAADISERSLRSNSC